MRDALLFVINLLPSTVRFPVDSDVNQLAPSFYTPQVSFLSLHVACGFPDVTVLVIYETG